MRSTTLTVVDIPDLWRRIQSPDRTSPIILVSASKAGTFATSPAEIAEAADFAQVFVLSEPDVIAAARGVLGWEYEAFDGAVRIISEPDGMQYLIRFREATLPKILTHARKAESAMRGPLVYTTSTPEPVEQPVEKPVEQPVEQPKRGRGGCTPECAAELALIREHLERVEATQERLHALLKQALPAENVQGSPGPLFDDPEEQFRHDVQEAYLRRWPPAERSHRTLRDYTVGKDFLASVNDPKFTLASYEQILNTVVDVLTRHAFRSKSRQAHPHGDEKAGVSQLCREDGASAYRCTISTTNGGPRLLWWEQPSRVGVELARVAHHDDYRMP